MKKLILVTAWLHSSDNIVAWQNLSSITRYFEAVNVKIMFFVYTIFLLLRTLYFVTYIYGTK